METTAPTTLARTCKLLGVTDRELAALRGAFARHDPEHRARRVYG